MPSGTGSPAPSSRRPRITTAPGSVGGTAAAPSCPSMRPMWRYGPTVCDGVGSAIRILGRREPAADDDVEPVAERPVRLRQPLVELADEPWTRGLRHRLEDRVDREQR